MADLRNSKQRDVILRVVKQSEDHPNAETILSRSKEILPSINLATVYRNLALLANNGLILRIPLSSGDRFDKTVKGHAHFHCTNCGEVFDVETDKHDHCVHKVESLYQCKINSSDVIFNGLCKNCMTNNNRIL